VGRKFQLESAIKGGQTRYTAVDGTPELKNAIINKFKRDNDLSYTATEVMVSSGGKQVFYNLCQAVLDTGDEVIIPSPYWVRFFGVSKSSSPEPIGTI
jgi:aspartate aminotransferase